MNEWWKAPVLQGEENDYGDYDYLIEDIPSNTTKWNWWYETCDHCGKGHKLNLVSIGYFRTMDGWDSMENCECWVCYLKRKIKQPFKTLKKKVDKFLYVEKQVHDMKKEFERCGAQFTTERKKRYRKIFGKEFK